MQSLHTLSLTFDLPLRHNELFQFRGAMADLAGSSQDLFHNHDNSQGQKGGFLQRYPLIQYRVHEGNASIYGINGGAEALEAMLEAGRFSDFKMLGRSVPLELYDYRCFPHFEPLVSERDQHFRYRIRRYLAFGASGFGEYKSKFALQDKIRVLQRVLRNHLVAFAWGVGWQLREDQRLQVSINDLDRVRKVTAKGQNCMAFDLVFSVNARLPGGVGIGRKTAFGFGPIAALDKRY